MISEEKKLRWSGFDYVWPAQKRFFSGVESKSTDYIK